MTTARPSISTGRGCSGSTSAAAPTSCQRTATSEHPGLEPCGLRHHRLIPRRVEDELDARLLDGRNALDLVARIIDQDVPHAAARSGEGHLHLHDARAIGLRPHVALVDQAE